MKSDQQKTIYKPLKANETHATLQLTVSLLIA